MSNQEWRCNTCGFTVHGNTPEEHGIGFSCGIGLTRPTTMNQPTDNELERILTELWDKRGRHSKLPMYPKTESIKQALTALRQREERLCDEARIDEAKLFNRYFDDNQAFKGFAQDRIKALTQPPNKENL